MRRASVDHAKEVSRQSWLLDGLITLGGRLLVCVLCRSDPFVFFFVLLDDPRGDGLAASSGLSSFAGVAMR